MPHEFLATLHRNRVLATAFLGQGWLRNSHATSPRLILNTMTDAALLFAVFPLTQLVGHLHGINLLPIWQHII